MLTKCEGKERTKQGIWVFEFLTIKLCGLKLIFKVKPGHAQLFIQSKVDKKNKLLSKQSLNWNSFSSSLFFSL